MSVISVPERKLFDGCQLNNMGCIQIEAESLLRLGRGAKVSGAERGHLTAMVFINTASGYKPRNCVPELRGAVGLNLDSGQCRPGGLGPASAAGQRQTRLGGI